MSGIKKGVGNKTPGAAAAAAAAVVISGGGGDRLLFVKCLCARRVEAFDEEHHARRVFSWKGLFLFRQP